MYVGNVFFAWPLTFRTLFFGVPPLSFIFVVDQLEQAWWFYEDFIADAHKHLPHFKLKVLPTSRGCSGTGLPLYDPINPCTWHRMAQAKLSVVYILYVAFFLGCSRSSFLRAPQQP